MDSVQKMLYAASITKNDFTYKFYRYSMRENSMEENEYKKVVQLPFPRHKVRDEIARIAREDTSQVVFLDHANDRKGQRDITSRQILNVLKDGNLIDGPNWCTEVERGWRCKLSRVTAGVSIAVVAKLVERDTSVCLVVTTFIE